MGTVTLDLDFSKVNPKQKKIRINILGMAVQEAVERVGL